MRVRLIISALIVTCLIGTTFAQTNLDLEAWTGNECDGWGTLNSFTFLGAPQTTFQETVDPGEALSSAMMETGYWAGATGFGAPSDTVSGFLTLGGSPGTGPMGIPYTQKPTDVSFMYKANVQPGDEALVFIQLSHYSGTATVVDAQALLTITGSSLWQNVTLPLTYFTTDTPDTLQINCLSSAGSLLGSPLPIIGSQFYVDDFSINVCAGPTASFTSGASNLVASFTDGSTTSGTASYSWDFGDGSGSSSQQNPSYTYAGSGTYNVCLTVTDSCSSDQICQSITVAAACTTPTSNFIYLPSGLTVTFADISSTTGTVTYAWDFGDGSGSSSQQNPVYTYLLSGTYNVCLTVTDNCNSDQICLSITVTAACTTPTANFSSIPSGLAVAFADISSTSGAVTYAWDFGDGSGASIQQSPSYTYAAGGSYVVCLTVTDSCNSDQVCQSITVTAPCTTPTANFSSIPSGLAVAFADISSTTGTVTYAWDFGDGSGTSAQQNPVYTYLLSATYIVCLTVSDSCDTNQSCQNVTVAGCTLTATTNSTDESVAGAGDGTATVIPNGGTQPYTYAWSNLATTTTITGLTSGTYSVTVTGANGCIALTDVVIQVAPVTCNLVLVMSATDETSSGANDGTGTANVSGGTQPYVYTWSTNETTSSILNLAPGIYSCTITDAAGCTTGGTSVVQSFQCTLSGTMSSTDESAPATADGTASVTATGGTLPYSYLWSTSETTASISNLVPLVYDVTVTDANGCTYEASAAVNPGGVVCDLEATVTGTDESQAGANDGSATVSVTGGTAPSVIAWDNLATTDTISNLAPGDYTVVVQDALGCYSTGTYTVVAGLIISVYEQSVSTVSVKVYPNPAVDVINIEISGSERAMLMVFDFAGRLITELTIDQSLTELNTSKLNNGMYLYRLVGQNNDKIDPIAIGSGKFMIQR